MKTGILGGTFDPPHNGHLAIAEAALSQLGLDEVMFMPAHRNPLKHGRMAASAAHRLEMVRLMLKGRPNLAVCDLEIARGGPSYMVETLQELHLVRPADYWLILGADALQTFPKWKQPDKIVRLCRLGVVPRGIHTKEEMLAWLPAEYRDAVDFIDMPLLEVSSTDLREKLALKQPVHNWISREVKQYIDQNRLYRS